MRCVPSEELYICNMKFKVIYIFIFSVKDISFCICRKLSTKFFGNFRKITGITID